MDIKSLLGGVVVGIASCGLIWGLSSSSNNEQTLEEKNIAVAIEFYDRLLNQLDFESASELIGDTYIQHNPTATNGLEGVGAHIAMLNEKYPENHGEIKHIFANGDLVALHVHSKRYPEHLGNAIVDMFRIKDGKVVEHWDVVQAVPAESLNNNTMF
jgi:predicted SnoaL-like aldol condensation-catalyzing enzyme